MTGGLAFLVALLKVIPGASRAIEAIANLFRDRQAAAYRQETRAEGARDAEAETMQDTAEIADDQARNAARRTDARDIARGLREMADRTERPAGGGPVGAGEPRAGR